MMDESKMSPRSINGLSPLVFLVPLGMTLLFIAARRGRAHLGEAQETESASRARGVRDEASRWGRRGALGLLIGALEHDAGRRALVMGLKFARNRL